MKNDLEVLIIGGGFSGTSVAYQLAEQGINSMIVESGKVCTGSDNMLNGTTGPNIPTHSGMITTSFDSFYEDFSKINGKKRAKTFLELTKAGCEMLKSIAKKLNPNLIRELGSLPVGHGSQWQHIQNEYKIYKKLGKDDVELYSRKDIIVDIYGNKETAFDGGIFHSKDAILNKRGYIKTLLEKYQKKITIVENTRVTDVKETKDNVLVKTDNRGEITADHVVFATNGFYTDKNLEGLLKKKWTFIICYEDEGPNTPNSWTEADFYHYWTRQDGTLLIGGEDKFVKKDNVRYYVNEQKVLKRLENWANKKFPRLKGKRPIAVHYGITAKTFDKAPIVGKFFEDSRICYIVGCNAMGQTILTYGASLIPGILDYRKLDDSQKKFVDFLSPRRETLRK